jgi:hypothetical protein
MPGVPAGVRSWPKSVNRSKGLTTWRLPDEERPEGVSMVSVTQTPAGVSCRVESNLTSLMYGKDLAVGSLRRDEVRAAGALLADTASNIIGLPYLEYPEVWDLHRLDPSRTLVLREASTGELVDAAYRGWLGLAGASARRVTMISGQTARLDHTTWRSWSIYDKRTEAMSKHNPFISDETPGLLRVEARLRPRSAKADTWANWSPTLALTDLDLEVAVNELHALMGAIDKLSAAGTLALTRRLVKAGASANAAMRLASASTIAEQFGWAEVERLGVPERTVQRWRLELSELLSDVDADDFVRDAQALAEELFAADLAEGTLP